MDGEATLTRREAVRLLAALGWSLGAGSPAWLAGCAPDSAAGGAFFLPVMDEPDAMIALGRAWLRSQATPPTQDQLLTELGRSPGLASDAAALRDWIAARHAHDWLAGRLLEVNGFQLSATEVQLYALAARLAEEGVLGSAVPPSPAT